MTAPARRSAGYEWTAFLRAVQTWEFKPHTLDSTCLKAVDSVPRSGQALPDPLPEGYRLPEMVTEPGWYICTEKGYAIHDHDGYLWAHTPRVGPCPLVPERRR